MQDPMTFAYEDTAPYQARFLNPLRMSAGTRGRNVRSKGRQLGHASWSVICMSCRTCPPCAGQRTREGQRQIEDQIREMQKGNAVACGKCADTKCERNPLCMNCDATNNSLNLNNRAASANCATNDDGAGGGGCDHVGNGINANNGHCANCNRGWHDEHCDYRYY